MKTVVSGVLILSAVDPKNLNRNDASVLVQNCFKESSTQVQAAIRKLLILELTKEIPDREKRDKMTAIYKELPNLFELSEDQWIKDQKKKAELKQKEQEDGKEIPSPPVHNSATSNDVQDQKKPVIKPERVTFKESGSKRKDHQTEEMIPSYDSSQEASMRQPPSRQQPSQENNRTSSEKRKVSGRVGASKKDSRFSVEIKSLIGEYENANDSSDKAQALYQMFMIDKNLGFIPDDWKEDMRNGDFDSLRERLDDPMEDTRLHY